MQKITFWDLITSPDIKKICIPTIQRDYALGRRNKVDKRNSFLIALKTAVCSNEQLPLDFVYGVDNETMFIPLDGQQRLTTLWLLHWFIAYKAGLLNRPEIKKTFLKFSYETRLSSTDFCRSLCELSSIPVSDESKTEQMSIRTWIMKQTWFYHQYKQDPTIVGMLNMIAGTEIADKNGNDIIDGLEELFSDQEYDFHALWEKLVTSPCIIFNKLKVGLDDSDELYVKMNARGKQLTDFENFKTELVQYTKNESILGETGALDFAAKLDVQWTDIFWDNRWEDAKTKDISIDEIYFAFIRRYVRLKGIKQGLKSSVVSKINKNFTNFEPYSQILDKQSIIDFITIMDNLREHKVYSKSIWGESFDFVPKYIGDKKENISTPSNTQLLIFYGCCAYLLHGKYEEKSYTEWNRVLWNICENRVDKSDYLPTIKEIDILAPYSHNIIEYLADNEEIDCEYNKKQLQEEQSKARHISEHTAIMEMEGYAFFKGAIRFLFTGSDKEDDWNSFETKVQNVKTLIPTKREERHTIRQFVPYVSKQSLCDIFYHWTSNNDDELRNILLYDNSIPFIHNFLLQNNNKEPMSQLHQDIIDICEEAFGGRGYLQSHWGESKYVWTNYQKRSGYFGWTAYVLGNEPHLRVSTLLQNSALFEIHKSLIDRRIGIHIPSVYIHFKYKNNYLTLYGNSTICLMTDQWEEKWENPNDTKGYYFPIQTIATETELIENIENLLKSI